MFKCNTVSVSPSASSVVVSSKEEKQNRGESGDSFVNVYQRLQLTCLLLSAIGCCRLCLLRVLQDACPFCFLQYTALPTFCNCHLFCMRSGPPPLQCAFHTSAAVISLPISKHTGGDGTTPAFSGLLIYLLFMWEVSLPPSPVELSSHNHFYKLSRSKVARQGPPLLPSPACLFIYSLPEGLLLPHSLGLGVPHPLCYVSFFFLFSCLFII
jgi:hypothetical protein